MVNESLIVECPTSYLPPSFLAPSIKQNFSTSSPLGAHKHRLKIKGKHLQDVYAIRQAQMRKEANVSRQAAKKEQADRLLGDPVRGVSTPFVESFDHGISKEVAAGADDGDVSIESVLQNPNQVAPSPSKAGSQHLDFGLSQEELGQALQSSRALTEPATIPTQTYSDLVQEQAERENWELRDRNATEAITRITSLSNSNSGSRTKNNIARIVDKFGRHNTDKTLRPKALADVGSIGDPTPRAGPDTGSSEVQIGILTAKIRVLADRREANGFSDMHNKRNLRLLVHRRQKLLRYMEQKERGSERWQHMIESLGLTSPTWKGEITVE